MTILGAILIYVPLSLFLTAIAVLGLAAAGVSLQSLL